jgi:hypothetical protein
VEGVGTGSFKGATFPAWMPACNTESTKEEITLGKGYIQFIQTHVRIVTILVRDDF